MVLAKNLDVFNKDYDFVDSIITDIRWDLNMLDLLISIDYFWNTQGKTIEYVLRFIRCQEAAFKLPKACDFVPRSEWEGYVYSWYTIVNYEAIYEKNLYKISIKTIDDNPRWLTVLCDEVLLEEKSK